MRTRYYEISNYHSNYRSLIGTDNSNSNSTMKISKYIKYSSISIQVNNNFIKSRYMYLVITKRKILSLVILIGLTTIALNGG